MSGRDVRITHVPYKGAAPSITGLLSGEVHLLFASIPYKVLPEFGDVQDIADLIALQAVEEGGLFRRLWDSIRLFFFGLFN